MDLDFEPRRDDSVFLAISFGEIMIMLDSFKILQLFLYGFAGWNQ